MTRRKADPELTLRDGDRVGIIAGGGALPGEVAGRLVERGHRPFVIALDGEGGTAHLMPGVEGAEAALEDMGRFVGLLKAAKITHVVMAGSVGRRPRLAKVRWNFGLLALLPALIPALRKGDDAALRAALGHFEKHGIRPVGAHEIVPDLLAEEGVLTKAAPKQSDFADIEAARIAARAIGALDIGQAAVSIGGRVIALEGVEGTDAMLERVAPLRNHGRLAKKTRGVIAKCAKPGQDLRADLPAIGPETVRRAHEAGLAGIVVDAGRTLFLDRAFAIGDADRRGLFIVAVTDEEKQP